jgi:pimeloyl-ACP methyl ester carboxylesterase
VLVHGAFADAMSWARVIPMLQHDGYRVVAVEQPLTSFDVDVATVTRVIDAQPGPVVAVGHSYGGATITAAAAANPKVKALVYVAALAPDSGEAVAAFLDKYPAPLSTALVPDSAGFLYIDRAKLRDVFAADLPRSETDVMAATQKPIAGASFQARPAAAAWRTIPSWFLVARHDRAINPELERFYARRMNAHTVEVNSSHVPFLSQPAAVVRLIEQAARAAIAPAPTTR